MSSGKCKTKLVLIFGMIIGFAVGFVTAAHWDSGTYKVQKLSPFYDHNVRSGWKKLESGLIESTKKIKKAISN